MYFSASERFASHEPSLTKVIDGCDNLVAAANRDMRLTVDGVSEKLRFDAYQVEQVLDEFVRRNVLACERNLRCARCDTLNDTQRKICSSCQRPLDRNAQENVYTRIADPDDGSAKPREKTRRPKRKNALSDPQVAISPPSTSKNPHQSQPLTTQSGDGTKTSRRPVLLAVAIAVVAGSSVAVWGMQATLRNSGAAAHRDESGCYDAMFSASRTSSSGGIDVAADFKERLRTRAGTTAEGFAEYKNVTPTPAMQACDRFCALWARSQGAERARFMNLLVKCLSTFTTRPTESTASPQE